MVNVHTATHRLIKLQMLCSHQCVCVSCPADGQSPDDWHRSVGEMVRSGLQLPGGRGCDRRRGLSLLCGPGRPHRSHEASPGPALLRILQYYYLLKNNKHTSKKTGGLSVSEQRQ